MKSNVKVKIQIQLQSNYTLKSYGLSCISDHTFKGLVPNRQMVSDSPKHTHMFYFDSSSYGVQHIWWRLDEQCAGGTQKCVYQTIKNGRRIIGANGRGLLLCSTARFMNYLPKCKTCHNWPCGGASRTMLEYVKHFQIGHLSIKNDYLTTCSCWDSIFKRDPHWLPFWI